MKKTIMKSTIKLTALCILMHMSNYLQAQVSSTNTELHNRYWNYRENFRKYFVVINQNPEGGMPFVKANSHTAAISYQEQKNLNNTLSLKYEKQ